VKKILVPCDGSGNALRAVRYAAAQATASRQPVEVELLHVLEPVTATTLATALSADKGDSRFPAAAEHALQPATQILDQAGVAYKVHCRLGSPAPKIVAQARESGCEAVVMGTRGLGPIASVVIGSVANQVVHLIDVPITLIK
jgi:nucleotide-binding universal stress UspA family protein